MHNHVPISVIVIGRNEGERLHRCLESVRAADYPSDQIELIYVDTDSTDDSCAVAEKCGARVLSIKPNRPTAAAARNAGLYIASHERIQFMDGDTILNPSWLSKGVPVLDQPEVACVFGRVEEFAPNASIYNYWAHHDWYVPAGRTDSCGGVALFRRDVLLRVGGFDSSLIAGEERDLCYRLLRDECGEIICLDAPMVLHDINMTSFTQYWRRCYRAGYAYAQVSIRHKGLRRWRRTCRRNMLHACVAVIATALSAAVWSVWPILVWAGAMLFGIIRNALCCRKRVGSAGSALLYAFHHYLSKIPTVLGHLDYCIREFTGLSSKRLIEHRQAISHADR